MLFNYNNEIFYMFDTFFCYVVILVIFILNFV